MRDFLRFAFPFLLGAFLGFGLSVLFDKPEISVPAVSIPVPPPLPDRVVAVEVAPKGDGKCLSLVRAPDLSPEYVVRPCPSPTPSN